ncbi:MAG: DUF4105 domain-containing protein [Elusimicrobiales bacterium]|nr:DUF4105 domain-containing protein [Elusimicrobiales bacterium]
MMRNLCNSVFLTSLFFVLISGYPFSSFASDSEDSAAYSEFDSKFIIDEAWLVIAAESNSPISMMGHSFLLARGNGRENAVSYFTNLNEGYFSAMKSLFGYGRGYYIVQPYSELLRQYLYGEKRSLWEFKLDLTEEEKKALKERVWQLYGRQDYYKFITHNCNNAVIDLLSGVNADFDGSGVKPFMTPVEYAAGLYEKGKIISINYRPADYDKRRGKPVVKNILESKSPARISIIYGKSDNDGNSAYMELSPVYQDIRATGDARNTESEVKLSYARFRIKENSSLGISEYSLLRLKSINRMSSYLDLGYKEDNIAISGGLGFGYVRMGEAGRGGVSAYILPVLGIRHGRAFASSETGIIVRGGGKFKTGTSLSLSTDYNTGKAFISVSLWKNADFLLEYEKRYIHCNMVLRKNYADKVSESRAGIAVFF